MRKNYTQFRAYTAPTNEDIFSTQYAVARPHSPCSRLAGGAPPPISASHRGAWPRARMLLSFFPATCLSGMASFLASFRASFLASGLAAFLPSLPSLRIFLSSVPSFPSFPLLYLCYRSIAPIGRSLTQSLSPGSLPSRVCARTRGSGDRTRVFSARTYLLTFLPSFFRCCHLPLVASSLPLPSYLSSHACFCGVSPLLPSSHPASLRPAPGNHIVLRIPQSSSQPTLN